MPGTLLDDPIFASPRNLWAPPPVAEVTFTCLPSGYVPFRSLFASAIFHEITIFLIIFLGAHNFGRSIEVRSLTHLSAEERHLYLPVLGGGREGNGRPGGGSGALAKVSHDVPAPGSKGLSYPGKQPIVSDPPNPLNFNQTLLHAGLKNLPILQRFTPLPNLVQSTSSAQPLDLRANKSSLPVKSTPGPINPPQIKVAAKALTLAPTNPAIPKLQPAPAPEISKLTLPLANRTEAPQVPVSQQQPAASIQEVRSTSKPISEKEIAQLPTRGNGVQNLISLSPTPVAPAPSLKIPLAETRGRFAVSPEANTASATPVFGSATLVEQPTAAIGNSLSAPSGNVAAEVAAGAGANRGAPLNGNGGTGSGTGTGEGTASGNGGTETGAGRGSGNGTAVGTGAGTSAGGGTGSGSGHGGGIFAGITIQGGHLEGATTIPRLHGATPVPAQSSYGITVVSTASSGGGLPDYGVFSGERVYTVYLDARTTTDDSSLAWTLQYAPLRKADAPSGARQRLTPPYAMYKEIPQWPGELVKRYQQRVIVVSGVMDEHGKLSEILIVQSPDDRLTDKITQALDRWVFRSAELNGQPVPIKFLLGIPVVARQ